MYEPNALQNLLPKFLDITKEKLGWTAPSYAPFLDIPIVGEYLAASLVVLVHCAELCEKIKRYTLDSTYDVVKRYLGVRTH